MFKTLLRTLITVNLINVSIQSNEIINKTVALNDLVELQCNFLAKDAINLHTNDSYVYETTKNESFLPENEFNLFIFKKNDSLVQLKKATLIFQVRNVSDSGVYECGYYEIDNYGKMSYVLENIWDIRVLGTKF